MYGDPLAHMHILLRDLGLTAKLGFGGREYFDRSGWLLAELEVKKASHKSGEDVLSAYIEYAGCCTAAKLEENVDPLLHLVPIKMKAPTCVADVGKLAERSHVVISYNKDTSNGSKREEYHKQKCQVADLHITQPAEGQFSFDKIWYSFHHEHEKDNPVVREKFSDIGNTGEDFRPHLHRIMEIYARVPRKHWHNPAMYKQADTTARDVLCNAARILFGESEIADKLDNAYKTSWHSIPRMSLGVISMHAERTHSAIQQMPQILEHIALFGIEDPHKAQLIAQAHLVSHIMMNGFQQDPQRAAQLLAQLKGAL